MGFGIKSQDEAKVLDFPANQGLFKNLREDGAPLSIIGNNREIYGKLVTENEINKLGAESFSMIPVRVLDRVEFVVFADASDRSVPFTDEAIASMTSLANQGAMALERQALLKKLQRGN